MGMAPGDEESNYRNFTLYSRPSHGIGSGRASRPFHPQKAGHTRMRDIIIARLKPEKIPGVKV